MLSYSYFFESKICKFEGVLFSRFLFFYRCFSLKLWDSSKDSNQSRDFVLSWDGELGFFYVHQIMQQLWWSPIQKSTGFHGNLSSK